MKDRLIKKESPEDIELKKKNAELSKLQNNLADLELELSTLKAELRIFENKYLKIIGIRFSKLDQIKAKISELNAQNNPNNDHLREEAFRTRAKAYKSAKTVTDLDEDIPNSFEPSEELKNLYREIAKRVHPDFALDEDDRARRNKIMAEVNQAYENSDDDRLRSILEELEHSPEAIQGDTPGAKLVRVIRKINIIQNQIIRLNNELTKLKESEIYQLMVKVLNVKKEGGNLLKEMAEQLDQEIAEAYDHLKKIQEK